MARLIGTIFGLAAMIRLSANAPADAVDSLVQQEMLKHHIAGLALNVSRDGQPIKTECYGKANLEWETPVGKDTVFEIGSVTKQFTAACILMLVQEGKLSLDDKINGHLKVAPTNWANIRLRHLLTHTSGIRNYTTLDGFEMRKHLTQEQFIRQLGDLPLEFQPGDSWHYCNSGFNLLGYIIENVSGQNYWDFLRQRVFMPLGMNSTTRRDPGPIIPHRAAGYEMTNHQSINRDYDLTDLFAAGAIVSTVVDMSKWDAALDGKTLLDKTSKESWWTPIILNTGKVKNYGFGWNLDPFKGHKNIGHGGSTSGFSASIQRFPDDHLGVIVLCNADELDVATGIAKKVAESYFGATAAETPKNPNTQAPKENPNPMP